MIDATVPFVLLDDARRCNASPARLYTRPQRTIVATDAVELERAFEELKQAQQAERHVAGFLSYEAGFVLEPKLSGKLAGRQMPTSLCWFGIFDGCEEIEADTVPSLLPEPDGSWLGAMRPSISRAAYGAAFDTVEDYIAAGDIYQANLTFRASARYAGNPLALYAAIRPRAAAGYGGVIWTGQDWFLSFSPELFFALRDGRVTAKPMKGTAIRGADPITDKALADELRTDPKQRAENLMIVDLLRNDLSRIAKAASVEVPHLFAVESYPTVHQMTSTVTAELDNGKDAFELLRAIYPCGSITGAPKIRAMEIIDEVETSPRGIYCGSIGRIDPNGDAAFNVAIRTFHLNEADKQASLGLGSGVVADSEVATEWAECLAKGEFARVQRRDFDLIETMRFEPAAGILRLELHLERMKASAQALDFEFDRHEARNRLHAATFHLDHDARIRLLASPSGALAIEIGDAPAPLAGWQVSVVPLPVDNQDFRLRHKTTDRAFYDDARKAAGTSEILFHDKQGYLTEGSFTCLFVERDGRLLTPPLQRGLLPSVLRRDLIESGKAFEAELTVADLANGFLLGNSLRGLIPATRVA
ncbi:aminodeoxychorismate synthase component I [Sphingorhabdus sp.]|uniref:aminodeoxychorismate synthase component I n=1 Tax=Sphingorhabdus sp. TaxID=1902408 RepID=UPI002B9D2D36|nr:aminodeoxychorismate synthase component I [Sphingorhabdus sp.]HMT40416.1 aminodeoxychorismate synthase component I [Sphingorhabdus sp.]